MGAKAEVVNGLPDSLKWAVSTAVLVAGLGAFYYFSGESLFYRVVGLLVAVGISVFVAAQTEKGREIWGFMRDARTEVRKVVWPTRRETLQTTGIVLVVVFLVAIMMWIMDTILGWLIGRLLGWGS